MQLQQSDVDPAEVVMPEQSAMLVSAATMDTDAADSIRRDAIKAREDTIMVTVMVE